MGGGGDADLSDGVISWRKASWARRGAATQTSRAAGWAARDSAWTRVGATGFSTRMRPAPASSASMASATWRLVSVATTTRWAEASTAGPDESSSLWTEGPLEVGWRRARWRDRTGQSATSAPRSVRGPGRAAARWTRHRGRRRAELRQAVDLVSLGHDSTLSTGHDHPGVRRLTRQWCVSSRSALGWRGSAQAAAASDGSRPSTTPGDNHRAEQVSRAPAKRVDGLVPHVLVDVQSTTHIGLTYPREDRRCTRRPRPGISDIDAAELLGRRAERHQSTRCQVDPARTTIYRRYPIVGRSSRRPSTSSSRCRLRPGTTGGGEAEGGVLARCVAWSRTDWDAEEQPR